MLQLKDETPFSSSLALFADANGVDTLYIMTKATFRLDVPIAVAEQQVPVTMADEYWGEPGTSSLKYASDVHLSKPTTDVALVGSAYAPEGRAVSELDASISVGPVQKTVHVVGERDSSGLLASTPEPFETMPLVWERAYGGSKAPSQEGGSFGAIETNPVGQGYGSPEYHGELHGGPVPNVIDERNPKRPAGFGFLAPNWLPRRSFAGTYDTAWEKSRAPYLPLDFDPRFFNAAHPDLTCPAYLQGGEPVQLVNVARRSRMDFYLPNVSLEVSALIAKREERPVMNLETVLFEPDDERMSMLWRSALPCDKEALKVQQITIRLEQLSLNAGSAR